jgi:hypothetical protein
LAVLLSDAAVATVDVVAIDATVLPMAEPCPNAVLGNGDATGGAEALPIKGVPAEAVKVGTTGAVGAEALKGCAENATTGAEDAVVTVATTPLTAAVVALGAIGLGMPKEGKGLGTVVLPEVAMPELAAKGRAGSVEFTAAAVLGVIGAAGNDAAAVTGARGANGDAVALGWLGPALGSPPKLAGKALAGAPVPNGLD